MCITSLIIIMMYMYNVNVCKKNPHVMSGVNELLCSRIFSEVSQHCINHFGSMFKNILHSSARYYFLEVF